MARIEASTHIEADPARVWEVLTDWESQPRWMADARVVTVRSDHRRGPGVVLRCMTNVAVGVVVADDMVITEWEEGRLVGVRHTGRLIRGVGAFELHPTAWGTRFLWWEEVDPPFGGLGEMLTTLAVAPAVARLFRSSLAALKRVCEPPIADA
jgi:carbon monoxide dehydrogenase subunit G